MRSLFNGQSLSFDNHIPNSHLKMDNSLHFHKNMTIPIKGQKRSVSGLFYIGIEKVDVQWENHSKISKKKDKDMLKNKLQSEIINAINRNGARDFFINIKKGLDSIFSVDENKEKIWETAFDNIMSGIGLDKNQKKKIKNENNDLFCLYLSGQDNNYISTIREKINKCRIKGDNGLSNEEFFNSNFSNPRLYYITADKNQKNIKIGELVSDDIKNYEEKGFNFSGEK